MDGFFSLDTGAGTSARSSRAPGRGGREIHLKANGRLSTDSLLGPEGGRFERSFTVENVHETPSLTASEKLKGWSLLSWTGPFMYVGQYTIIDPDGRWLPDSLSSVDEWIEKSSKRSNGAN
jgi:hypothetical protein